MKKIAPAFLLVILIAAGLACQVGSKAVIMPTPVETDACCLNEQPGLEETLAASLPEATGTPLTEATAAATGKVAAAQTETPRPNRGETLPEKLEPGFFRQGALFGTLDPYAVDDVAILCNAVDSRTDRIV